MQESQFLDRGDSCAAQSAQYHPVKRVVWEYALEDSCESQIALLVALVAKVSQAHLRDTIAIAMRKLIVEGHAILSTPGAVPVPQSVSYSPD